VRRGAAKPWIKVVQEQEATGELLDVYQIQRKKAEALANRHLGRTVLQPIRPSRQTANTMPQNADAIM
jgi:hypothetical protein